MKHGAALVTAARVGFTARGLLYLVIGFLAFRGRAEDPRGAMKYAHHSVGAPVLFALAAGFLAYGLWRVLEAYADSEGRGSGMKAVLVRLGGAGIGLIYFGFAYSAFRIAQHQSSAGGGDQARSGAALALHLPGGRLLLVAAAAAFLVAAGAQFWKAYRLGFLRHLKDSAARNAWVKRCGRIGLAGRGLVFTGVAYLLLRAALHQHSKEAGGSGDALAVMPAGLRALAGAALILFGIFSFIEAMYREIKQPRPST